MQKIGPALGKKSIEYWNRTSTKINESFGLTPTAAPRKVYTDFENSQLRESQPGIINKDMMIINTKITDYEKILPATVAKLCFQSSMPTDILCDNCMDDLSFEYARQDIDDDSSREIWEMVWSKYSPPRKISPTTEYYPIAGYKWLYSVAGERGLEVFIKELTLRVQNQIPLSFEEYMQYFSKRIQRFERTLSSTELKIVRTVIENPDFPSTELAKIVGITEEWTSIKLAQLQKRMVLRKYNRAPYSKIGIHLYQILINRGTTSREPLKLFKACPFLYAYRKVVSGDCIALATLAIPDNRASVDYLQNGLKKIEKKGFTIDVHKIQSSGIASSFDYYSPEIGQWDIPWELLEIHLQRIQSDNLAPSMPRVVQPEQRSDVELDELDMKIFKCIREGLTSVSKIRNRLRVGQHRVAAHLQNLRKHGLVIRTWEAYNIGLSEHVLVNSKNKKTGEAIAAWALRLPKSIISYSSKNELLLLADLPKGGVFGLSAALERFSNDITIGILSPQTYGMWGFPSPLWDSKLQKWKCPKKKLEAWISKIA